MIPFCRSAVDQHQHGSGGTGAPEGISTPAASLFVGQAIRNVDQGPIGLTFVKDHLTCVEVQRRLHGANHDHGLSRVLLRLHK